MSVSGSFLVLRVLQDVLTWCRRFNVSGRGQCKTCCQDVKQPFTTSSTILEFASNVYLVAVDLDSPVQPACDNDLDLSPWIKEH